MGTEEPPAPEYFRRAMNEISDCCVKAVRRAARGHTLRSGNWDGCCEHLGREWFTWSVERDGYVLVPEAIAALSPASASA